MASNSWLKAAQTEMMESFKALNNPFVEELDEEPSPLEFMRFVGRNLPFVVRGAASGWKATQRWDASYLKSALQGQTVNVAVTPMGNADAPTYSQEHDRTVISKPHEEAQPFDEFLNHVIQQEIALDQNLSPETRYAQTPLQKQPEAINLWIGNSKSVTAMHKDNYENIFVQIIGRKHFVLLPPLFHACVNEQLLSPATYVRQGERLALRLDPDAESVPMATWDPDQPLVNQSPMSHLADPLRVTLNPGDMLYLPAMWYYKVKQSCIDDQQGFVLAINYWYDMDFNGPLYSTTTFLRSLGLLERSPSASITPFQR